MIKTDNFTKMKFWIGRILILLILFFSFAWFFLIGQENSLFGWIISIIILFVLIGINQVGDFKIENDNLTYEIKSLIPFLREKNEVNLSNIESINLKADQSTNERGFMLTQKNNKNIVEVNLKDGTQLKIPGKIYPEGALALKQVIELNRSR